MPRPLVIIMFGVFLVAHGAPRAAAAQAQWTCPPEVKAWTASCDPKGDLVLEPQLCRRGVVVIGSGAGLLVEIRAKHEGAFRQAAGYGVSPVGDFPDWRKEPAERRRVLDAIVECLSTLPTLSIADVAPGIPEAAVEQGPAPTNSFPWSLVIGLGLLFAAVALRIRQSRSTIPAMLRSTVPLVLLGAATFVLRRTVYTNWPFHQNGQGPLWISMAVGGPRTAHEYGPGYAEVLSRIAALSPRHPEAAVVTALALCAASIPVIGYALARATGAPRLVSWALALLLAGYPLLGRLAQSESYFSLSLFLLFLAAGPLGIAMRQPIRTLRFWLPVVGAGFVLAQVVRVHPTAWLPAAMVPALVALAPERVSLALRKTALAYGAIGLIVALISGPVVLGVVRGPLGAQWMASTNGGLPAAFALNTVLPAVLAVAACGAITYFRPSRWLWGISMGVLTVALARATNLLAETPPYGHAYEWLFAPLLLCCVGAVAAPLDSLPRRWSIVAAGAVVMIAAWDSVRQWTLLTTPGTDALEVMWAAEWRERLPPSATVLYVGAAGKRRLFLPIYSTHGMHVLLARAGDPTPTVPSSSDSVYYYRSSLCSVPEGAAACEAIERAMAVVPVETRELPARASLVSLPMGGTPIQVGLFRVVTASMD